MIRRHTNTGPVLGGMSRRPHAFRRAGFSLVEILVVITIIALLASLILAAVLRALDAGTRTENFTEIAQLESAIGEAKRKLNLPQIPAGPFHLKPTYTGTEPELEYLMAAWPQAYPSPTTGAPWAGTNPFPNVHLDSNQTLLFFLTGSSITNHTGFSTNPAQPFAPVSATNAGAPRVGPFLQTSTKYFSLTPQTRSGLQLQSTASPTQANPTPGVTVLVANQQFPWIIDPYGLPFAYFPAYDGKTNMYYAPTTNKVTFTTPPAAQFYTLTFTNGTTSTVIPYQNNGAFINPQGFQIISSGKDMYFGSSGTLPPSAAVGYDDQANFSKVTLGGWLN